MTFHNKKIADFFAAFNNDEKEPENQNVKTRSDFKELRERDEVFDDPESVKERLKNKLNRNRKGGC